MVAWPWWRRWRWDGGNRMRGRRRAKFAIEGHCGMTFCGFKVKRSIFSKIPDSYKFSQCCNHKLRVYSWVCHLHWPRSHQWCCRINRRHSDVWNCISCRRFSRVVVSCKVFSRRSTVMIDSDDCKWLLETCCLGIYPVLSLFRKKTSSKMIIWRNTTGGHWHRSAWGWGGRFERPENWDHCAASDIWGSYSDFFCV